ncbi:MAG TPA: MBL fold metallo-hydrolase [Clostridia bacterium]|jgi:glyoxylase-like metal-dependent hydrolase (beta-lactamase superfamily II)|nr:MBL fold metallo-hydrolase [Clostridia bacterium]
MYLKKIELGPFAANCYIIGCEDTKEAAVIDPGGNPSPVIELLKKDGYKVTSIINTHGHIDHIAGNEQLKAVTNAPICIHSADAGMLGNSRSNLSAFTGMPIKQVADRILEEGDIIKVGNIELEVLHTPGHTPGGICLKTEGLVFTGDTLFAGSIGRTDFPGGSYRQIIQSIKEKLLVLDGDTKVLPGHGPDSTIQVEKIFNPFLIG